MTRDQQDVRLLKKYMKEGEGSMSPNSASRTLKEGQRVSIVRG